MFLLLCAPFFEIIGVDYLVEYAAFVHRGHRLKQVLVVLR